MCIKIYTIAYYIIAKTSRKGPSQAGPAWLGGEVLVNELHSSKREKKSWTEIFKKTYKKFIQFQKEKEKDMYHVLYVV